MAFIVLIRNLFLLSASEMKSDLMISLFAYPKEGWYANKDIIRFYIKSLSFYLLYIWNIFPALWYKITLFKCPFTRLFLNFKLLTVPNDLLVVQQYLYIYFSRHVIKVSFFLMISDDILRSLSVFDLRYGARGICAIY